MDSELDPNMDPNDVQKLQRLRKRQEDDRKAREEKELHEMQIAQEAEMKTLELDELFKGIPQPEQRRIRLEAAIIARATHNAYGGQRQLLTDNITLELARYAVLGKT